MDNETRKLLNDQIASIKANESIENFKPYPSGRVTIFEYEGGFRVNGKQVFEDMDGNYQCNAELPLTVTEQQFLGEYLEMLENTSAKFIQATYTL